jgi:hypothetical protein
MDVRTTPRRALSFSQMKPNRRILMMIVPVGLIIRAVHLYVASLAVFVFRAGEPWTSWVSVLLGPGATLAGVIVSILSSRIGGAALLILAALAFVAFVLGENEQMGNVWPFALGITLPMAALGAAFLAASRRDRTAAAAR